MGRRGIAREVPGSGGVLLTLRENSRAATGCAGFDPVSFAVTERDDLDTWVSQWDLLAVEHSLAVEASVGWLLVLNDPDGLELHLYTPTGHGLDHSHRPGYGRPVAAG